MIPVNKKYLQFLMSILVTRKPISVVHLLFSSSEAEMIEAYLNKNKHSRGGDGGGIRNTNRVEVEDEAKGKNMERLEVEADNTKDKIEE